jgi:GT2 family glycosyltransferase
MEEPGLPMASRISTRLPLVYIVILSFNGARYLEACLKSLLASDYPNVKMLLVDNNSQDSSVILVRRKFPEVEIIENDQNLGFAGGMNIGIRYALAGKADYIFLVNQDASFDRDCLTEMLAVALSCPQIGLLVPMQFEYGSDRLNSVFQDWLKKYFSPELADLTTLKTQPFYDVAEVSGAALLISRKALEVVGLFDPIYFAYSDESDLCRRLIFHGFRVALCSRASFWHETRMTPWKRMLVDRSRLFFAIKNPNKTFFVNFLDTLMLFLWFLEKGVYHRNISYILFMISSLYDILHYLKPILERISRERKGYGYLVDEPDTHYHLTSISNFIGKDYSSF